MMEFFALTDKGLIRDNNEDAFTIGIHAFKQEKDIDGGMFSQTSDGEIFVVADGMGGAEAGEIAAQIAIDSIQNEFLGMDFLPQDEDERCIFLRNSIYQAHQNIIDFVLTNKHFKGMGTTIVVAWLIEQHLFLAWCGDSRCYCSSLNGKTELLSEDHSKVWEMVKNGLLTPEQARLHPQSHILSSVLGDKDFPPKIETKVIALQNQDRLLLCSDGLNAMLPDDVIYAILNDRKKKIKDTAIDLVEKAKQNGGYDNITVIVLENR